MRLIFILLVFLLSACSTPKRFDVEFDNTKRIQKIQLTEVAAVYAQEDQQLNDRSLDIKLSEMRPQWDEAISQAQTNETWGNFFAWTQFLTLLGCISTNHTETVLALCGTSILAFPFTLKFSKKSQVQRMKVIDEYNQQFSSSE